MTAVSPPSLENRSGSEIVDIRTVLVTVWKRRWLVVSCMVVVAAVFGIVAYQMTPIYRATTVLVSTDSERGSLQTMLGASIGQLGGLASVMGLGGVSGGSKTQEALALLRSREFTETFIREEELMPVLFSESWDPDAKGWRGEERDWPTTAGAFHYFHNEVRSVNLNGQTGLVTLEIEWSDPKVAAHWANRLVERLNEEMRARATAQTDASIGFLERELASTATIETRQAILRLMEAQMNQRMLANVTKEYAFRVVDRAIAPDRSEIVRPNRTLLIVLGAIVGSMLGVLMALLLNAIGRARAADFLKPA